MPDEISGYVAVAVLVVIFAALLLRRWARQDRGEVNASDDATINVLRDG